MKDKFLSFWYGYRSQWGNADWRTVGVVAAVGTKALIGGSVILGLCYWITK